MEKRRINSGTLHGAVKLVALLNLVLVAIRTRVDADASLRPKGSRPVTLIHMAFPTTAPGRHT